MSQVEAVHHLPRGYGATEVWAWPWPSCGAAVAELIFIVYFGEGGGGEGDPLYTIAVLLGKLPVTQRFHRGSTAFAGRGFIQ
jgi:hypothetical protein